LEVAVKAAMGQAGAFHQVGDADSFVTTLAEQPGGDIDDTLAVQRGLFPAHFHDYLPYQNSNAKAARAKQGRAAVK
jgi:hypothetical protein